MLVLLLLLLVMAWICKLLLCSWMLLMLLVLRLHVCQLLHSTQQVPESAGVCL
jgi:hypothetical protein